MAKKTPAKKVKKVTAISHLPLSEIFLRFGEALRDPKNEKILHREVSPRMFKMLMGRVESVGKEMGIDWEAVHGEDES